MTEDATTGRPSEGVHRLVDMIVEEVSLVDRAANKHRFLIVKRDDTMDEDTTRDLEVGDAEPADDAASVDSDEAPPSAPLESDTPLGAAVEALERLTEIVELLGALGESPARGAAADLATQLRLTAEALLSRVETADGVGFDDVALRAKAEPLEAPATFEAPAAVEREVAKTRASVAAVKARVAKAPAPRRAPAAVSTGEPPAAPFDANAVTKGLESLSDSLKTLTDLVREQQQRLGRVEKQFGLPNSAAAAERVVKAQPQEVGWPLDLNKPMDRENVDKAVSFHDL
jgi:hypothetical protein